MEMIKKRNTPVSKEEVKEIVNEIKYKLYHYNISLDDLWKVFIIINYFNIIPPFLVFYYFFSFKLLLFLNYYLMLILNFMNKNRNCLLPSN